MPWLTPMEVIWYLWHCQSWPSPHSWSKVCLWTSNLPALRLLVQLHCADPIAALAPTNIRLRRYPRISAFNKAKWTTFNLFLHLFRQSLPFPIVSWGNTFRCARSYSGFSWRRVYFLRQLQTTLKIVKRDVCRPTPLYIPPQYPILCLPSFPSNQTVSLQRFYCCNHHSKKTYVAS